MVPFERVTVVSYRLSIVTAISNLSDAICHRKSTTLKSTVAGHFGAKSEEKWFDRCMQNFLTQSGGRDTGLLCAKKLADIFCRLSTMQERDIQTYRQTDRPNTEQ